MRLRYSWTDLPTSSCAVVLLIPLVVHLAEIVIDFIASTELLKSHGAGLAPKEIDSPLAPGSGTGRDGRSRWINTDGSPRAGRSVRQGPRRQARRPAPACGLGRAPDPLAVAPRLLRGGRPLPQRGLRPRPPRPAGPEPVPAQARVPRPADVPQCLPGVRRVPGLASTPRPRTSATGPYPGMIGADPAATAQDDDYEYRRSRTPVPEFVAEAVEIHLAKVYDQEVSRDGPDDLMAWWRDVDGRGTPIDDWMRETVAPLLLVLGCIDVCLDHPKAPPGRDDRHAGRRAAAGARPVRRQLHPPREHGLVAAATRPGVTSSAWSASTPTRPTASTTTRTATRSTRRTRATSAKPGGGTTSATGSGGPTSRSSSATTATRSSSGSRTRSAASRSCGWSTSPSTGRRTSASARYEAIAEYQREYYNRDSELILSDTLAGPPVPLRGGGLLQGGQHAVGRPGLRPADEEEPGGGPYQGWEFVSPPKDPAESLRRNKAGHHRYEGPPGLLDRSRPAPCTGSTTSASRGSRSSSTRSTATSCWSRSPSRWRRPSDSSPSTPSWCCGTRRSSARSASRSGSSIRHASSCSPRPS